MKKIILHLCADIGSDSWFYQQDSDYEVIKVGKDIGVENYNPPDNVYGIIANPVCTEFSTARKGGVARNPEKGMFLVNHCLRIIKSCNPKFWVIENPATGALKDYLSNLKMVYQPYEFGSPFTKKTALWGNFNAPKKLYKTWEDVPNKELGLYVRKRNVGTDKPNLPFLHKSAVNLIPEFKPFVESIKCDADLRSLCSQGFAKAFYEVNR